MIFSLLVIASVGIIAYVWASRGFFSALIHLFCVVVAGAIAFAAWEPLAYAMLDNVNARWLIDISWAAALAVPFALSLAILRLTIDKIIPANVDLDGVTNLVGGGLCGAISGTISVGILTLSIGLLRLQPDYMGYLAVDYDSNGSLKRNSSLLYPVDRITATVFSSLSSTTFRPVISGEPLAEKHPDLELLGPLMRTNFNEGRSFHTLKPNAFRYIGRYTVGFNADASVTKDLGRSKYGKDAEQRVTDINGDPVAPSNSYIEGHLIHFKAAAKEQWGEIVLGSGQVRLVIRAADGSVTGVQPLAMISQAKADKTEYGRWRFETPNIYIRGVGASAEADIGFEFLVPRGSNPIALYVKGVRVDLTSQSAAKNYINIAERDQAIKSSSIFSAEAGGGSAGNIDAAGAVRINTGDTANRESVIRVDAMLPGDMTLRKAAIQSLVVDDDNVILDGEQQFYNNEAIAEKGLAKNLIVREFILTEDTSMIKVEVSLDSELSFVKNKVAANAEPNAPITLIDSNNQKMPAIGFIYKDGTTSHIRYTPSRPLVGTGDLPQGGPTQSRPDQRFILLFRVSKGDGLRITGMAIGDQLVANFSPPVRTSNQR